VRGSAEVIRLAALVIAVVSLFGTTQAADSTVVLRSHYVEGAEGVPINVVESGPADAPAVLLLHGFAQSHFSWTFQLQSPLAGRYHLIAMDLRGHGNSGKPWTESSYVARCIWADDVRRVIAATARRPVWLVGWSFGSWVVVDYLTCFGQNGIAGVALVGGLGGLLPPAAPTTAADQRQAQARAAKSVSGVLAENFEVGDDVARLLIHAPVPDTWRVRAAAANVLMPPYARVLALKRSFDHQGDIGAMSLPVLIVAGDQDPVAPVAQARVAAARLPRASLQIIAGAGHTMMAEQPDTFNRILADFIERERHGNSTDAERK